MSAVSSVVSSAVASATPSGASCATANFSQFPTQDVACAVGSTTSNLGSNTSSVLEDCCKSAPVESFNGDCGYYCLSVQQSVADLQSCFLENGIAPSTIFCNSNNTATATGTPSKTAGPTASGTKGDSSGTASPGASGSTGAAVGVVVPQVSKAGLGMLGMIAASVFAGAVL